MGNETFYGDGLKLSRDNFNLSHKMFRFPSPDRPIFLEKSKKKKNSTITCKELYEASTLTYMHTILCY